MFDIIVIGSATIDAFAKTNAEIISISGENHGKQIDEKLIAYPLGTKMLIKELEFKIGGGGTNVCATFSKQKLKTAYIGKIGKDDRGRKVFSWLKENNITFLGQVGGETGYGTILDSQANDRIILLFRGSNDTIEFNKLPKEYFHAKWFYGCSMMNKSYETMEQLFILAKKYNIKTAFNPSNYLANKGLNYLKKIIENTDVLILNKEEAELLVGKGDVSELLDRLNKKGPKIITITDGNKGAYIGDYNKNNNKDNNNKNKNNKLKNNKSKKHKFHISPAKNLKIVETTGAGDGFGSGIISGLIQGKSIEESALMGVINSEGIISAYGAKEYIATREEMEQLLKKKNHKIEEI